MKRLFFYNIFLALLFETLVLYGPIPVENCDADSIMKIQKLSSCPWRTGDIATFAVAWSKKRSWRDLLLNWLVSKMSVWQRRISKDHWTEQYRCPRSGRCRVHRISFIFVVSAGPKKKWNSSRIIQPATILAPIMKALSLAAGQNFYDQPPWVDALSMARKVCSTMWTRSYWARNCRLVAEAGSRGLFFFAFLLILGADCTVPDDFQLERLD